MKATIKYLTALCVVSAITSMNAQNTLPANGNVGIKTTSPIEPLQVVGNVKIGSSAVEAQRKSSLLKFGDGEYIHIGEFEYDDRLSFKANFYNFSVGNVGIGVPIGLNPSSRLTVNGLGGGTVDLSVNGRIKTGDASNYGGMWVDNAMTQFVGQSSSSRIGLWNSGWRFQIDNLGYVGIGVDPSQEAQVKIKGEVSVAAAPNVGDPNAGSHAWVKIGNYSLYTGMNSAGVGPFMIRSTYNPSVPSLYIANTGNVGIGTSNPTSTFTVNGVIASEEIIVQDVGADYVFDENYELKSLDEVEKYIKANKHLPGVAPASETEQGIKVGEFNEKLLEKIEELTLYMIELKKQNDALTEKVVQLEANSTK